MEHPRALGGDSWFLRCVLAGVVVVAIVIVGFAATVLLLARSESNASKELRSSLSTLQSTLDFSIIVPSYIPRGTLPKADGGVQDGGLDFFLWPSTDMSIPKYLRPTIEITETTKNLTGPQPGEAPGAAYIDLEGHQVSGVFSSGPSPEVSAGLSARLDGVSVVIFVIWRHDEPQQTLSLTDDMKGEAIKIFDSMIKAANQNS